MSIRFLCLAVLLWRLLIRSRVDAQNTTINCEFAKVSFDPTRHKRLYTVGVLANRGFEVAYREFNRTFSDYLTSTAGQHFDPPIRFEMKPLQFSTVLDQMGLVDFVYVNPSAFSCIESELAAQSLATQISRRNVSGTVHNLKMFGGVITARADNDAVSSLHDLSNKVIAAASINGLGSGQMQFLEMKNAGMSYINDPKQLVFTSNQDKIVNGVLNRDFDVGFIRTDQLERSTDAEGKPINASLFKIINTKANLTVDGKPFPFQASTPLYPEWNVAALSHVPEDVSRHVQAALLNIADYGRLGTQWTQCQESNDESYCDSVVLGNASSCTPRNVALTAVDAMTRGKFSGWQTTLSYIRLHFMQEATGFISKDPSTGMWQCVRSSTLYDSIICPEGFSKDTRESVESGCSQKGLECDEGFQCVCSPCVPIEVCENGAQIGNNCVSFAVLLPAILVPAFLLLLVCVHYYVEWKHKQSDAVWIVKPNELQFQDPPVVIGQGTFGQVLLSEYRGTQVAVKRVIPPAEPDTIFEKNRHEADVEQPASCNPGLQSMAPVKSTRSPYRFGSLSDVRLRSRKHRQLKEDFVREMRHLAKLRHPNITTAMGAVVSRGEEPMLVMEYMHNGSLYDAIRNETISLDSHEDILTIVQDIAHGLRFLHSACPAVTHGDLKTRNILIDSNFRAKVADFGLSAKKQVGARGTPYWMAPELLTGESSNTDKSDIYAFAVLLYEVYARKDPYEGEDYNEVLRLVCDPTVRKRPPVPAMCPPAIAVLYSRCLEENPNDRPTTEQVDLTLQAEGTVQRRTFRIATLNRELVETNKTQLEHFACMSHEIRTPLNCIIGISSLLEEERSLDSAQKDSVKMIASSGKLLREVIDDVLSYSKFLSGNAEIDIKRTDLQETMVNLVNSMKWSSVTERKQVSICTFYDPLLPRHIETDGRRLQQILYNLLSNAVKFSRVNGVVELSVLVCSDNDTLNEDEKTDEKCPLVLDPQTRLRFDVTDHGKGVDASEFERIFQPFTQTNAGINNTEGGTGLGLAITRQLVELLGGTIAVDSQIGQWTKFSVTLPLTVSTADRKMISSRLSKASVHLVCVQEAEIQNVTSTCDFFNVDLSHFRSLKALEDKMDYNHAESDSRQIFLVQRNLYDEFIYTSLSKRKTILITFGDSDSKVDHALVHYQSLTQMFPSVLMQELVRLCNSKVSTRRCASNHAKADCPANLEHLRILIAEDNKINQKVLVRLLQRLGVTDVKVADDGKVAVDLEASEPFDCIFMDMQMPIMDGIEACKLIVARTESPPKIIFLSAHVSEDFREMCVENGATDYLAKPCTLNDLREMLEKVMNDNP